MFLSLAMIGGEGEGEAYVNCSELVDEDANGELPLEYVIRHLCPVIWWLR